MTLISVSDAASQLGIKPRRLAHLIAERDMPHEGIGKYKARLYDAGKIAHLWATRNDPKVEPGTVSTEQASRMLRDMPIGRVREFLRRKGIRPVARTGTFSLWDENAVKYEAAVLAAELVVPEGWASVSDTADLLGLPRHRVFDKITHKQLESILRRPNVSTQVNRFVNVADAARLLGVPVPEVPARTEWAHEPRPEPAVDVTMLVPTPEKPKPEKKPVKKVAPKRKKKANPLGTKKTARKRLTVVKPAKPGKVKCPPEPLPAERTDICLHGWCDKPWTWDGGLGAKFCKTHKKNWLKIHGKKAA